MTLSIGEVSAQQRATDLLVRALTGSYSEALDAKARLQTAAIESVVIKGDFDKASVYATSAYKVGITPEELIGRIIALTLVDVDRAKTREDVQARKNQIEVTPDRLTFFNKFIPGISVKRLKENKSSDPSFAAYVVRENLQGLANKGEPAFLALLGLKPKESLPKKEEPTEYQMIQGNLGCCHGHNDI